METKDRQIIAGALLHDVGKILFRCDYYGNISHPESGFRFLKEEAGITDREILDCVRYHHADAIKEPPYLQTAPRTSSMSLTISPRRPTGAARETTRAARTTVRTSPSKASSTSLTETGRKAATAPAS